MFNEKYYIFLKLGSFSALLSKVREKSRANSFKNYLRMNKIS